MIFLRIVDALKIIGPMEVSKYAPSDLTITALQLMKEVEVQQL